MGVTCFNPGSFANDGTFIAYRPATREAEMSSVWYPQFAKSTSKLWRFACVFCSHVCSPGNLIDPHDEILSYKTISWQIPLTSSAVHLHHLHKVIFCNPLGICTNGYLQQSKWQPLDIPTRPADFYEWTIGAKASWAAWRRTCGDPEPCKNCWGWLLTKLFQVWVPICPLLLLMLELIHLLLMPEGLMSEMNGRGSILPAYFQRAFDSIVGTIFLLLLMSRCRNPPTSWGGRFSRKIISIQSVQGLHIYLSCQTID